MELKLALRFWRSIKSNTAASTWIQSYLKTTFTKSLMFHQLHVSCSFIIDVTSYDLTIKGNKDQFLSEKLLEKLAYQSLHPIYSYDDDLFSLGMVALVMASQQNPSDFYSWEKNKGTLNKKLMNDALKLIEKKYSCRLANKIKSLLNEGNEDN